MAHANARYCTAPVRLITRRSEVQILPPPLRNPRSERFSGLGLFVEGVFLMDFPMDGVLFWACAARQSRLLGGGSGSQGQARFGPAALEDLEHSRAVTARQPVADPRVKIVQS